MTDWPGVLRELDRRTRDTPVDDLWFFLTAVGLTEASLDEATAVVDLLAGYVPDLATKRIADLGCGAGRHLAGLVEVGGTVVGIESSAPLAEIARGHAVGARVEHGSFHDLAEHGAFDVVCAFAHCLLLVEDEVAVVRALQSLRGAMPDHGLLVLEVMPAETGETRWDGPPGVEVRETREATETGHRYRFEVEAYGTTSISEIHAVQVAPEALHRLAEEAGFHLEAVRPFDHPDGSSSVFCFLRATKGFNYLSDLTEFLESWSEPGHPRNARPISWAAPDATERVRPEGSLALGQGSSLSKHHPDFRYALEDRIRPLALELAEGWNYVTYSSCGGHLVSPGSRAVYSEAYCGLVAFDNRQIATVGRLIRESAHDLECVHVDIGVRVRPLHGETVTLTAADVLFRRASTDTRWGQYAAEVRVATRAMATRLTELRGRR